MAVALAPCCFPGFPALVENENRRRDARAVEELSRQPDDSLKDIFLDEMLADDAFCPATEQDSMGNNDSHFALTLERYFDHMADKGVITPALGGNPSPEAVEAVVTCVFMTPLIQGKRRIGNHDIEPRQFVVLDQPGVVDGIAPLNAGGVHAMQEHVHPAQGPGGAVGLLPEEGKVLAADFLSHLNEERP